MTVVRSPNYPAISLADAITRVSAIFQREHKHPTHRDVLAKDIGYGSWNGASSSIISALHKYGLLEPVGDKGQYKVSDDAIDILVHQPGDRERVGAILKTAFMPTLFSELHTQYGDNLPSDQSIRTYLLKKDFNPKSVDGVIRTYRDTIEFVNVETQDSIMESLDEGQEVPMQTQLVRQVNPSSDNVVPRSSAPPSSLPERGVGEKVWSFDLSEDCSIRMVLTGHVTKEALENLKEYIDISIKTAPNANAKQPLLFEEDTDHHKDE
jgi:hypothetical protein